MAMRNGEPVEAMDLLKRIKRYRKIFRATKGGITLSGGEVLMQPAFALKILKGAKAMGVHTAIDTSGFLGRHASEEMLDNVDLVLLDIKSGDPAPTRKSPAASCSPPSTLAIVWPSAGSRCGSALCWCRD